MNKKHKYNQRIISELCKKYNVEADTVRKSLRGDRTSETSESIKKDYYKALNALNKVTAQILAKMSEQISGVEIIVPVEQDLINTSKLAVQIKIQPLGYLTWIVVTLGLTKTI